MLGKEKSKIRKIANKRSSKQNFWFDWETVKLFYCLKLKKLIKRWRLAFDRVYFYYPVHLSFWPLIGLILLSLIFAQILGVNAFEAHTINVTARIVDDTPRIIPGGGQFCDSESIIVTIASPIDLVDMIYTLDGSQPECGEKRLDYAGEFTLNASTTVKARVCHKNGHEGQVAIAEFSFSREHCENGNNLLITKVYYDVDSAHGDDTKNEFVEIYNPNNQPVDVSGWKIMDNSATDIIPKSSPIPAFGFAIITDEASTWNYWEIPDGVVKIVLDSPIGNGLSNSDDRVVLLDLGNAEVDAMSYGGDTYAFDPSCSDVAEGRLLVRVPFNQDTNQASDWKDLGLPTVNLTYPVGGEIWWVGRNYDITWTAVNPNGSDSALNVALYYSADSGLSWAQIVNDTDNDGTYNWRVPLFIGTYYMPSEKARIKIVVTGLENFLVQDIDMSEDFCPPIDYDLLTPEERAMLAQWESGQGLFEPEQEKSVPSSVSAETEKLSELNVISEVEEAPETSSQEPEVVNESEALSKNNDVQEEIMEIVGEPEVLAKIKETSEPEKIEEEIQVEVISEIPATETETVVEEPLLQIEAEILPEQAVAEVTSPNPVIVPEENFNTTE